MPSKQPRKQSATKWKIERVKLADVRPFEDNPRTIQAKNQRGLRASLNRFGYVDLIVWNRVTGNIVAGHQRYQLLMDEGVEEADMIVVELPPEEELAANLTLNNPEIEGEWDDPITDLLESIERTNPDLFEDVNLAGLRDAVEAMVPREGKDSYEDKNAEIDIDDLVSDCDGRCPCCSFVWEMDDKDVSVMTAEEKDEING